MKEVSEQITLEECNPEYQAFVDKFKPKKTTDDCYTPDNVYEVVKNWACEEYNINPENVVRPFWPGTDYKKFPYTQDSIVIDNPPFSILASIVDCFNEREIPFFLFSPYLTCLNSCRKSTASCVVTGTSIMYQNGADVHTSFITNMDGALVRTAPELSELLKIADSENRKAKSKEFPKYSYPIHVLRASDLGYMSSHGVSFAVSKDDACFIRRLDSQRMKRKEIFGGGLLLSERAAAERAAAEKAAAEKAAAEKAAAEKAAAEKAAAIKWELSEREWEIIKALGNKERK